MDLGEVADDIAWVRSVYTDIPNHEPSCLMVYGPGNYRFFDFMKVGSLLTVAIFALAILLVPLLWPLGG